MDSPYSNVIAQPLHVTWVNDNSYKGDDNHYEEEEELDGDVISYLIIHLHVVSSTNKCPNWVQISCSICTPEDQLDRFCFFCFLFWQLLHQSARVTCERDTKSHARHIPFSEPAHAQRLTKDSHNTGNFMPCSFRIVCGFFNVPQWTYINVEGICETGPTVYRPYPRRLESLTICWFNYKGSTLYSVILRPWVLFRPESNSRPPAWQPDVPPLSHWYAVYFTPVYFLTTCKWQIGLKLQKKVLFVKTNFFSTLKWKTWIIIYWCEIWTIKRWFFPFVKSEINCASDGLVVTTKTSLLCSPAVDQSVCWISCANSIPLHILLWHISHK